MSGTVVPFVLRARPRTPVTSQDEADRHLEQLWRTRVRLREAGRAPPRGVPWFRLTGK